MDKPLYDITTDAAELIARTSSRVTPAFTEAAAITEGKDPQRSLAYLKSFADSIDRGVKAHGRDKVLVASAGNIKQVKNYETIVKAMDQLTNFLGANNAELANLRTIHDQLVKFQPMYTDGYKLGVPLVTYEYEAASSTLIRGISVLIVTQVDPQVTSLGAFRFSKVKKQSGGAFTKLARDMAKELRSNGHGDYLKGLLDLETDPDLKVKPEDLPVTEAAQEVASTAFGLARTVVDVIRYGWNGIKSLGRMGKTIIRSMFGIIPLIRSVIYLHYKRKADTIANLELQAHYVELNIEQLENMKTMDPKEKEKIIRKQQAYVEAYRKKAEKLRAELMDCERSGTAELKADNSNIKPSDDYVLD